MNTTHLYRSPRSVTFKFTTVENERITCSFDENLDIQIDSLILTDRVSGS